MYIVKYPINSANTQAFLFYFGTWDFFLTYGCHAYHATIISPPQVKLNEEHNKSLYYKI